MILTDRNFNTSFFEVAGGGDPILYQHLFLSLSLFFYCCIFILCSFFLYKAITRIYNNNFFHNFYSATSQSGFGCSLSMAFWGLGYIALSGYASSKGINESLTIPSNVSLSNLIPVVRDCSVIEDLLVLETTNDPFSDSGYINRIIWNCGKECPIETSTSTVIETSTSTVIDTSTSIVTDTSTIAVPTSSDTSTVNTVSSTPGINSGTIDFETKNININGEMPNINSNNIKVKADSINITNNCLYNKLTDTSHSITLRSKVEHLAIPTATGYGFYFGGLFCPLLRPRLLLVYTCQTSAFVGAGVSIGIVSGYIIEYWP